MEIINKQYRIVTPQNSDVSDLWLQKWILSKRIQRTNNKESKSEIHAVYTGSASEAGKLKVPNFFMKHLLSEFFFTDLSWVKYAIILLFKNNAAQVRAISV